MRLHRKDHSVMHACQPPIARGGCRCHRHDNHSHKDSRAPQRRRDGVHRPSQHRTSAVAPPSSFRPGMGGNDDGGRTTAAPQQGREDGDNGSGDAVLLSTVLEERFCGGDSGTDAMATKAVAPRQMHHRFRGDRGTPATAAPSRQERLRHGPDNGTIGAGRKAAPPQQQRRRRRIVGAVLPTAAPPRRRWMRRRLFRVGAAAVPTMAPTTGAPTALPPPRRCGVNIVAAAAATTAAPSQSYVSRCRGNSALLAVGLRQT